MVLQRCLVLHDPASAAHRRAGHPERPARLEAALRGARNAEAVADVVEWDSEAPLEAVLKVHAPEHVERVREACASGGGLDGDTYALPASWHAALAAAGACLEGVRRLSRHERKFAYALVRPPGHHATRERAGGFCLLNNAAIAAQALVDAGLGPVAIFDHDVHHGNGTQDIFWARDDVLYASFHLHPHYPGSGGIEEQGPPEGKGRGATLNFPMQPGWGDAEASLFLEMAFLPWARRHKARSLVVSAGFDSHAGDPLGGLALTNRWYGGLLARLASLKLPLLATLEGGYVEEHLEASVEAELRGLAKPSPSPLSWEGAAEEARARVARLRREHGIG